MWLNKRQFYDIATIALIIALLHSIRQYTRDALAQLQTYAPALTQLQTGLEQETANLLTAQQTLETVQALSQKVLLLNYIAIPLGIFMIWCIIQSTLWKQEYKTPRKEFIKTSAIFILAGYALIYTTINAASLFLYAEPTSLILWIASIILFIAASYLCLHKCVHYKKSYKKIAKKIKLYKEHIALLASTAITTIAALVIYFFLQTATNITIPAIITLLGIILTDNIRHKYILKSKKAFKAKQNK